MDDVGRPAPRTPVLLHIDSSARMTTSTSRKLGEVFEAAWLAANPDGLIVHRDLTAHPVPHQDEAGWMAGMVPPIAHDEAQARSWAISEPLILEVEAADEFLFSVPMYNLSVPSTFKAWVDRVIVVGRTLVLDGSAPPLGGRRATVVSAAGGGYTGTPRQALDHHQPYLRDLLEMLGLDLEIIRAELTLCGIDPAMDGLEDLRDASLASATARAAERGRLGVRPRPASPPVPA